MLIRFFKRKDKKKRERDNFFFFGCQTGHFPHVIIYLFLYIFGAVFSYIYWSRKVTRVSVCVCSAFLWSFRYSKRSNTEEVCFHSHQFLSLTQSPIILSFFPSIYASKSLQLCELNQIDLQLLMGIALCTNCK